MADKHQTHSASEELLQAIAAESEVFWANPDYTTFEEAMKKSSYTLEDVKDAEARLQRFASFICVAFPETEANKGIIGSKISRIPNMKEFVEKRYQQEIAGELYLKRDDTLPIAGTIKARGAIYEVLKHAETLALEHGLLKSTEEDYVVFASEEFRNFFAKHHIAVGTTGNLGISVRTMGAKLGFNVTVHVSVDAKQWKKDFLRSKGVEVIEHKTNFSKAVEQGRAESEANPNSYFVDDEHSEDLFLGYTVGGLRMKRQLEEEGIQVDVDHPLFVYLPCGIGGSPGGHHFWDETSFWRSRALLLCRADKNAEHVVGIDDTQIRRHFCGRCRHPWLDCCGRIGGAADVRTGCQIDGAVLQRRIHCSGRRIQSLAESSPRNGRHLLGTRRIGRFVRGSAFVPHPSRSAVHGSPKRCR